MQHFYQTYSDNAHQGQFDSLRVLTKKKIIQLWQRSRIRSFKSAVSEVGCLSITHPSQSNPVCRIVAWGVHNKSLYVWFTMWYQVIWRIIVVDITFDIITDATVMVNTAFVQIYSRVSEKVRDSEGLCLQPLWKRCFSSRNSISFIFI